jgi:hypothetical protein
VEDAHRRSVRVARPWQRFQIDRVASTLFSFLSDLIFFGEDISIPFFVLWYFLSSTALHSIDMDATCHRFHFRDSDALAGQWDPKSHALRMPILSLRCIVVIGFGTSTLSDRGEPFWFLALTTGQAILQFRAGKDRKRFIEERHVADANDLSMNPSS